MKKTLIGNGMSRRQALKHVFYSCVLLLNFSLSSGEFVEENGGYGPVVKEELIADADPPLILNHDHFTLITIPHSGFSIILKALYALSQKEAIWHTRFPSSQYIPLEEGFLHTHFCLSPDLEANYASFPNLKRIVLIRDFRDVVVSMLYYIQDHPWPGMTELQRKHFLRLNPQEQLLYLINFEYDTKTVARTELSPHQVSLVKIAEQALYYARQPGTLTFLYEDFAPIHQGGCLALQKAQLRRLCNFLRLNIDNDTLSQLALELNEHESQEDVLTGKIGLWRDYFTEAHRAAFKKKLGPILIAFGYESDDRW